MPSHNDPLTETGIVADLRKRVFRHGGALAAIQIPQPAKDSLTISTSGSPATWTLTALPYNGTLGSSVNLSLNGQELKEGTDYTVDYSTGIVSFTSGTQALFKSTPTPADVVTADYWTTGDLIAATGTADTGSYSALVLQSSPLGYYRLAEPSGTTMTDSSGNSRNGTYSGTGVTLGTTGLLANSTNTAATFANGTGTCPATAAWDVSSLTLEAIGKTSVTVNSSLVARWTHGGTQCWNLGMAGSFPSVSAVTSTGTVFTATGSSAVGSAAHHYAATWSGGFLTLYLDGVQVAQTAVTGTLQTATTTVSPLVAARNSGENFWNGVVDEVAIYGTALSAATILSHAQLAGYA